MNLNIRYPSISLGNTEDQLRDIRSYLYQLTDTLNACDTSALSVMNEISQAITAGENGLTANSGAETEARLQEYASLRSLIIKTADYAQTQQQGFQLSLSGEYVAVSDFGKYFEEATVDIDGTPYGITQLYNYTSGVDTQNEAYRVQQESYIKSGLLYYDSNSLPVYGVGVGTIYGDVSVYGLTTDTVLNAAKTYYTKSGEDYVEVADPKQEDLSTYYERIMSRADNQIYSTFTNDEIAFWSGSSKLAYMNAGAIYFPNAFIQGGAIGIGDDFSVNNIGEMKATAGRIANWLIDTDSLHTVNASFDNTTGMYFGFDGLRLGQYFKVDSLGNLTCTSGTFSGKLEAATGSFAGTLSAGVSINSPSISGGEISGTAIYSSAFYAINGYSGTKTEMNASGLEIYVDDSSTPKVKIGTDTITSSGVTTESPTITLGVTSPGVISKMFLSNKNVLWVGNDAMTCGILFNFNDNTYSFVGTEA